MQPELIVDYECETGEGPLWHPEERRLYWVDIPNGRLFRYDPARDEHEVVYETDTIGGFTLQADGSLLLFEGAGRIERLADGETEVILDEIPDERATRFNDVMADPEGRVFCGTMPTTERSGRLYRLDTDGSYTRVLDGLDIPNGMGFTPDGERLYVTESDEHTIHSFAYDRATGDLTDRRTFVSTPPDSGVPDGMTVDTDGYVWSARWNGEHVHRYAPDGTEVRRIELPAHKVSSVAFGGPEYDDLYVTTARTETDDGTDGGELYRLDPDAQGREEFRSRVESRQ